MCVYLPETLAMLDVCIVLVYSPKVLSQLSTDDKTLYVWANSRAVDVWNPSPLLLSLQSNATFPLHLWSLLDAGFLLDSPRSLTPHPLTARLLLDNAISLLKDANIGHATKSCEFTYTQQCTQQFIKNLLLYIQIYTSNLHPVTTFKAAQFVLFKSVPFFFGFGIVRIVIYFFSFTTLDTNTKPLLPFQFAVCSSNPTLRKSPCTVFQFWLAVLSQC
jgi:hypothetical protein